MRITSIKATNIELTPALRSYIEEKAGHLEKLLSHDPSAELAVEVGKTSQHHNKGEVMRAEFNLRADGDMLRVEKVEPDLYKAIDKVKDHLERELVEHKERRQDRHRGPRPGKE